MLDAVQDLTRQLAKPPTLAELRDYLKYGNTSSVQRHIYALIDKGFITPTITFFCVPWAIA